MARILYPSLLCVFGIFAVSSAGFAQSRTLEGTIREFECGDNCYLTIVDKSNKEHTGLCTAPECAQWNEAVAMPSRFKGRRVVVTLGRGVQLDGSGRVAGRVTAFEKIRFVK